MAYEPLHHRYRPQRFDQLVGQEPIARTLGNALRQQRIAPAYLFTGPRGTGKTSSARILARSLNCIATAQPTPEPCGVCELCTAITAGNALDVIEIDAASNTGVDNIRELIERARFAPVQARWKVYVVDECHMLSTAAFNALLKTLEEPPPQVVFVLATTDPQRVLPTIVSRCQRFDFRRIPLADMVQHLAMIANQEAIGITPEAIRLVAQLAQGGLRDAESLLDQLSLLPPPVLPEAVWELMGAVPEQELLQLGMALAEAQPLNLLQAVRQLFDRGREPTAILQGVTALLRDLLLAAVAPQHQELSTISPANWESATALAQRLGSQRLIALLAVLRSSESQLRHSSQPRLGLEVLLVGLLHVPQTPSAPVAVAAQAAPTPAPTSSAASAPASAPTPVVSASASAAPAAAPVAAADGDHLRQVWQALLAQLELPSTRMLLSQQGRLLHCEGSQLTVEVDANWLAMVQIRLPLLNTAASAALGIENAEVRLTAQQKRPGPGHRKGGGPGTNPAPVPVAIPARQPLSPLPSPVVAPIAAHTQARAAAPPPQPPTAGGSTSAVSKPPATVADSSPPLAAAQPPSATPPDRPVNVPSGGVLSEPQTRQGTGTHNLEAIATRVADFFNGAVVEFNGAADSADGQESGT